MNRQELVEARGKAWRRLQDLLDRAKDARGLTRFQPKEIQDLSELYRALASDLMLVRRDKLGADLEHHLDTLASRAHNAIYAGSGVGHDFRIADLILDFPAAVRRNLRFFALASLLFYGPFFTSWVAAAADEAYALSIMDEATLEQMESMHRNASPDLRDINTDSDMTGFYIQNNVGIAFRCFATGVLFALGSMYVIFSNGLMIGTVFGHLWRSGVGEKLLTFAAAHSPWELTAIVISGAAGIQMGYSLVRTHGRTRLGNLRAHGLELLRQIAGASAFLFVAAAIEGNVSGSHLPAEAKFTIGALGVVIVTAILAGLGRQRRIPRDVLVLRGSR